MMYYTAASPDEKISVVRTALLTSDVPSMDPSISDHISISLSVLTITSSTCTLTAAYVKHGNSVSLIGLCPVDFAKNIQRDMLTAFLLYRLICSVSHAVRSPLIQSVMLGALFKIYNAVFSKKTLLISPLQRLLGLCLRTIFPRIRFQQKKEVLPSVPASDSSHQSSLNAVGILGCLLESGHRATCYTIMLRHSSGTRASSQ